MGKLEKRVKDIEKIIKYRNGYPIDKLAKVYQNGEKLAEKLGLEYYGSFYETPLEEITEEGLVPLVKDKDGKIHLGEPVFY